MLIRFSREVCSRLAQFQQARGVCLVTGEQGETKTSCLSLAKLAGMRYSNSDLLNTPAIEIWPALLSRARSNSDARALAAGDWVLRRKRDGRFLAVVRGLQVLPLLPALEQEASLSDALLLLGLAPTRRSKRWANPLRQNVLEAGLAALGIDPGYAHQRDLPPISEPTRLHLAGFDRYQRPLWMLHAAAGAWQRMRIAATREDIHLQAISGYRSIQYQHGIFERKLARGISIDAILRVNAAPGYSEHHSGRAIDISCVGEPAAEVSFELTTAFAWLTAKAVDFGFVMSYPRDNRHGVMFEPWHWCWHAPAA